MILYHGTLHDENLQKITRPFSRFTHFGTEAAARSRVRYKIGGGLGRKGYLYKVSFCGESFTFEDALPIRDRGTHRSDHALCRELLKEISYSYRDRAPILEGYRTVSRTIAAVEEETGYQCASYSNEVEDRSLSYINFYPEQVEILDRKIINPEDVAADEFLGLQ